MGINTSHQMTSHGCFPSCDYRRRGLYTRNMVNKGVNNRDGGGLTMGINTSHEKASHG